MAVSGGGRGAAEEEEAEEEEEAGTGLRWGGWCWWWLLEMRGSVAEDGVSKGRNEVKKPPSRDFRRSGIVGLASPAPPLLLFLVGLIRKLSPAAGLGRSRGVSGLWLWWLLLLLLLLPASVAMLPDLPESGVSGLGGCTSTAGGAGGTVCTVEAGACFPRCRSGKREARACRLDRRGPGSIKADLLGNILNKDGEKGREKRQPANNNGRETGDKQ